MSSNRKLVQLEQKSSGSSLVGQWVKGLTLLLQWLGLLPWHGFAPWPRELPPAMVMAKKKKKKTFLTKKKKKSSEDRKIVNFHSLCNISRLFGSLSEFPNRVLTTFDV